MKKPVIKVNWIFEGDEGFWTSVEGRFDIIPRYYSRTKPQDYELHDTKHKTTHFGLETVREAKEKARKICEKEIYLTLGIKEKDDAQ